MKKLILVLLTATAASCAVACFAGCTDGQTGGGDNAAEKQNYSAEQRNMQENAADEGDFGFLPPDMPMKHGDRLSPLPHGRIFNGMHPDIGQTADGAAEDTAQQPELKGHIRRKKNKKDQITPDGGSVPDNAKAEDGAKTEDSSSDSSKSAKPKRDKRGHRARPQQN